MRIWSAIAVLLTSSLTHAKPSGTDSTTRITVDHGDPAKTTPRIAEQLKPVIRILAGSTKTADMLCTGTAVIWDGEPGVLTAAHCLYEHGPREMIGPAQRRVIYLDTIGPVLASTARMATQFQLCVGHSYQACVKTGAPDIAFIPANVRSAWNVCTAPVASIDFVAFGFGKDVTRRELPGDLLEGDLRIDGTTLGSLWRSASDRFQQVNEGDSGGPVISMLEQRQLEGNAPSICFLVAARREEISLLQPVWMFDSTIALRSH